MSSEKMQILKMLEDGKINADEASRLLQSAGAGRNNEPVRASSYDSGNNDTRSKGYAQTGNSQYGNAPSSRPGSSAGFDDFAADLRRKFETLAKDMEPKIQRFVGTVAEKTADVANRVSKNINSADPHTSGVQQPKSTTAAGAGTSGAPRRNFELKVEPGYNELNLIAHNGDISITGYNGDKLTVNVYAKESRAGARVELMRLGSRYCLNYNESDFKTISIEALVPEKLFSSIVVGATNGQTNVVNTTSEYFTAQSVGGTSTFRGIRAENIRIDTGNGRLSLDEISAKNAHIEGSNGAVIANYLDAANLRLFTSNAEITMNVGDFRQGADYTWIIESSNARVSMNIPSAPRNGYHIKAATSLGNVRLGLPSLRYISNLSNCAEAISTGYDSAAVRINISVETSNAELSIN